MDMSKIGLIVGREFAQRVRKKSFIITTLLAPLFVVALIVLPAVIMQLSKDDGSKTIVIVDESAMIGEKLAATDSLYSVSSERYPAVATTNPDAYGFLVIGHDIIENPSNLKLYTREASTMGMEQTITNAVSQIITAQRIDSCGVANLDSLISTVTARASLQTFQIETTDSGETVEKASSAGASMAVAYIAGFIIYMFILMYGMQVLQGVIEEKSSRIIEVIVSSVKPFELMMGKIVGVALVALLQFGAWVAIIGIAAGFIPSMGDMAGAGGILGGLSSAMDPMFVLRVVGSFVIFFVGGYLLYAAMFAAIGSAVDSVADTQQLQMPVTMPLIISIFIMLSAMQDPHSSVAFWFSIIPFTSPIIMMARVAYGVPMWEFILSVVVLYGSFVGITYLAAKIYRTGIFMYGKKPTIGELIKWARYKN